LPDLFLNAHHHGSLPQQLKVVWSLLLQADPEGPTLIFRAASWRTISKRSVLSILTSLYFSLSNLHPCKQG
ncbi:MAG: hypothetical protein KJ990_14300, partial [Proteobacteria bacterium]|nr:hypothetical protein [Pseudomonadota bacterium]